MFQCIILKQPLHRFFSFSSSSSPTLPKQNSSSSWLLHIINTSALWLTKTEESVKIGGMSGVSKDSKKIFRGLKSHRRSWNVVRDLRQQDRRCNTRLLELTPRTFGQCYLWLLIKRKMKTSFEVHTKSEEIKFDFVPSATIPKTLGVLCVKKKEVGREVLYKKKTKKNKDEVMPQAGHYSRKWSGS